MSIETDFRRTLDAIHPLGDSEWNAVADHLRRASLKEGDHALQAGEIERHVRFLGRGILRQYYVKNGREHNKEIYIAPALVSSYTSFLTREPSPYGIQALEETGVLLIDREVIMDLYFRHHAWERLGRLVVERKYILKEKREALLLLDTAEERYDWLLRTNPDLIQRVNLYAIAAYLGIAPETLSRIRRRPVSPTA